jgi:hypothetical protein
VQECETAAGLEWSSRNNIECSVKWPQARAGHAGIFDKQRGGFWIHGGFTAYYPYLSTDGVGSGSGVQARKTGGFVPYPTYPFYLDDLWFYDLNRGNWTEITCVLAWPGRASERASEAGLGASEASATQDICAGGWGGGGGGG